MFLRKYLNCKGDSHKVSKLQRCFSQNICEQKTPIWMENSSGYYWVTVKIGLNGLDPDLDQNKHE